MRFLGVKEVNTGRLNIEIKYGMFQQIPARVQLSFFCIALHCLSAVIWYIPVILLYYRSLFILLFTA